MTIYSAGSGQTKLMAQMPANLNLLLPTVSRLHMGTLLYSLYNAHL